MDISIISSNITHLKMYSSFIQTNWPIYLLVTAKNKLAKLFVSYSENLDENILLRSSLDKFQQSLQMISSHFEKS